MKPRNSSLDFLRGIAILLVLFNHSNVNWFISDIGWIGVEIFFVLSGFLIAGLLLDEYQTKKEINFKRFFIRRGFKIYPSFYILVFVYLAYYYIVVSKFNFSKEVFLKLLSELFFVQNYFQGLFIHTWSLAVEEHFYLIIAVIFFLAIRFKKVEKISFWMILVFFIVTLTTSIRIYNAIYYDFDWFKNYCNTHIRIDSLIWGAFCAIMYQKKILESYFQNKTLNLLIAISCFVAIISTVSYFPRDHFFIITIGYNLIYFLSSIILVALLNIDFNQVILTKYLARMGFYSYSIYLWHIFVKIFFDAFCKKHFADSLYINILYIPVSIIAGICSYLLVERFFIDLRDNKIAINA